jgi:glycosyltransferase involved in cell wall biosynthesis
MSKPYIALFMPSLEGGGAERMMVHLANAFVKRGIQVDLVLVRAVGAYQDEVAEEVRIIDLQASRILTALPKLVRYLRTHRPEAMLSTLTFANVVATWACRWVCHPPRLVLREANTVSAISGPSSGLKNRLIPHLIGCFYPRADQVVTISKGAQEDLIKVSGLPSQALTTIYNPVVTKELTEKAQDLPNHPWFVEGTLPIILAVGRLEPQKNFETLIRAFRRVHDEKEARLLILGEGGERERLESLVHSLSLTDDVDIPGFVANPFCYMANSDLFVLSSRFEGLGNVLVEAMATGCPVVSTDCPSGPKEILEDGQWGTLVPVGDEEALATAILDAIDSPRCSDELRKRARAFSASQSVDQYLDVLLG